MPCLAKKYECGRDEFKVDGNPDVDYSISTRELGRLIKRANIDFANLPDGDFDSPLGESTGAGAIFANTGGVMEAALRTVYEVHTGKTLPHLEFNDVRGLEGIKEATIDLNGFELKVCVAHTLSNARKVMDALRAGKLNYHVVEVMACPGGCIRRCRSALPPRQHRDSQGTCRCRLPRGRGQGTAQEPREPRHPEALQGLPGRALWREGTSPASHALF